jgi:thymidylate synthase
MYIVERTLDDILNRVLSKLLTAKSRIVPGRGPATEIVGALIRIKNPRARLSRTEKRGKLFSSLGELLWYLAKSNRLDFIEYYIPAYKEESEDGITIAGAYGPRLFMKDSIDQVERVSNQLRDKKDSRNAVIQLFDARDLGGTVKNPPCTCTFQFFARNGKLHMVTHMRSNDAYLGLPHDVFCFTMLQEILAKAVGLQLGTYSHAVGSLHLYDTHRKFAQQLVDEGWQSTVTMPEMPTHAVWDSITQLLNIEEKLRNGRDGTSA